MIKYRALIFFLFSISLVGCTNPAQYIGELFPKANERAIYDERIEEESSKEVENKEVENKEGENYNFKIFETKKRGEINSIK